MFVYFYWILVFNNVLRDRRTKLEGHISIFHKVLVSEEGAWNTT